MLLCCPVCGNSFCSNDKEKKCDYCFSDTEVLFSDDELETMSKEELPFLVEVSKEKYKNENNPRYQPEMWAAREGKDIGLAKKEQEDRFQNNLRMQMTTTGYQFDGYRIKTYLSVISGNVVLGTGLFSELSASINDLLGTTSTTFENKIERAKNIAVEKLKIKSAMLGGNGVIGIDFDFFTLEGNMIAVSANGTSVIVEPME